MCENLTITSWQVFSHHWVNSVILLIITIIETQYFPHIDMKIGYTVISKSAISPPLTTTSTPPRSGGHPDVPAGGRRHVPRSPSGQIPHRRAAGPVTDGEGGYPRWHHDSDVHTWVKFSGTHTLQHALWHTGGIWVTILIPGSKTPPPKARRVGFIAIRKCGFTFGVRLHDSILIFLTVISYHISTFQYLSIFPQTSAPRC